MQTTAATVSEVARDMNAAHHFETCPDCRGDSDGCESCGGDGELARCNECGCFELACECAASEAA